MINNKNLYQYTLLAQASYADFWDTKDKDPKNHKLMTADKDIRLALIANEMGEDKKGIDAQALQVMNNWELKAHYRDRISDNESSFSGTLFKGKAGSDNAGEYVLAMQGATQSIKINLIKADLNLFFQ